MTKLKHLRPLLLRTRQQYCSHRSISKVPENEDGNNSNPAAPETNEKKASRPMFAPEPPMSLDDIEEPTNCCMSGCANCVWIQYAERLSLVLKDSPDNVQKLIMEKVQDPNMRAFLSMELRVRKIIE